MVTQICYEKVALYEWWSLLRGPVYYHFTISVHLIRRVAFGGKGPYKRGTTGIVIQADQHLH
jgi:hypothetical protein